MKPSVQKIINKLPQEKVDLATQKVDLKLDGQLKSMGQRAQSIFNDGRRDANQEILSAAGKMEQALSRLNKLAKDIDNTYADAIRKAKDIGVDLNQTQVGRNFKDASRDVTEYIMSSRTLISKLRKFFI
tara:strand:- start:348 stop:734 length:387 start_codon:yes stop_codon:yes gene_type:complete